MSVPVGAESGSVVGSPGWAPRPWPPLPPEVTSCVPVVSGLFVSWLGPVNQSARLQVVALLEPAASDLELGCVGHGVGVLCREVGGNGCREELRLYWHEVACPQASVPNVVAKELVGDAGEDWLAQVEECVYA